MQRVSRRTGETVSLVSILINEPRAFPAALSQQFKRASRAVWSARGGGLYACGFLVTFLWLEVTTFFGEIAAANSVGGFVSEQLFEFFIRFTVQSLANTVYALLWPLSVIQWSPVWGIAILAGMYIVFTTFLKQMLESWLFGDDPDVRGDQDED